MEQPITFQNYDAPSISTLMSVSTNMSHPAETVFPDNSYTSPCDSSYDEISSPPTVNHHRNRVVSYSFYDKNGSIPSVFLLPSLEKTPERATKSTMHLNFRLRNRIQLPCSAFAMTNKTLKIKKNGSSFSDFKSININNLRITEAHEVRKMTRRLSNSANAA